MLVLYCNLLHNKVSQYLSSFLPNTSLATYRYPMRHPRLEPPFHLHAFISQTCKYNLPDLLNRPISQTVFMLSIAINRAEHVCATVIIKHNYMLMCNHKIVINICCVC